MAELIDRDIRHLEESLRKVVAKEVVEQQALAQRAGRVLDLMDQRQIARAVLQRELDLVARESLRLGRLPLPDAERDEIAQRILTQSLCPWWDASAGVKMGLGEPATSTNLGFEAVTQSGAGVPT